MSQPDIYQLQSLVSFCTHLFRALEYLPTLTIIFRLNVFLSEVRKFTI